MDNNINGRRMDIEDEDIQVLMKITLLTPTNKRIDLVIPYLKKFCPKVQLRENVPAFIPLFHTLHLQAAAEHQQENATIDLAPLIQHPNHEHYLNVQTYAASAPDKTGSRYAVHVEFAQMMVRSHEPNYMELSFRSILMKVGEQRAKQMKPFLRVTVSHGSSWSGRERPGAELINYDETTTIMFHSLLDTAVLQLYTDKEKLCECSRFIFEFIAEGTRLLDLEGEAVRKATVKVASKPSLPIVIIE